MGWASTSDPRFLPAMLITGAMVLAFVAFFVVSWVKGSKTSDQLKTLAQAEGWAWAGSAPADLREALNRVYVRSHYIPSRVMVAKTTSGDDAFLFRFEAKHGFGTTSSTQNGIACLIVGRTDPNAPIYSIRGRPPGVPSLVDMQGDVLPDVGGAAFRERYFVSSAGYTGFTDKGQTELEPVRLAPALEEAMLSWEGPTSQGLPDGWSGLTIRDQLVMVYWHRQDDVPAEGWNKLLARAETISRVLKAD